MMNDDDVNIVSVISALATNQTVFQSVPAGVEQWLNLRKHVWPFVSDDLNVFISLFRKVYLTVLYYLTVESSSSRGCVTLDATVELADMCKCNYICCNLQVTAQVIVTLSSVMCGWCETVLWAVQSYASWILSKCLLASLLSECLLASLLV